jgi:membrane associated rhomboid family serine protease
MQKWKNNKWVEFSSPVTLTFTLLALGATLLGMLTGGASTRLLFSVYKSPMASLFFWPRLFLHVLGHADLAHFAGNASLLLVLGPIVEKHYGGKRLISMMALTALITAVFQLLMLLSAASGGSSQKIPLTLILVAVIYLGKEIYGMVFLNDNISQLSHIVGGLCGIGLGLYYNKNLR